MRRISFFLLLSCTLAASEERRAPLIFFRAPDPETKKEIEELLTSAGLGQATRDKRTEARQELRRIGRWSVPFLMRTIAGKKRVKGVTIPMNAVMTLARIGDPRCLAALREAAMEHPDKEVRKTACLALGIFGEVEPGTMKVLLDLLADKDFGHEHQRTAALALGKIPEHESVATLLAATNRLPPDEHAAAAILLAASIRTPDAHPERFLAHKEELVRKVAAACLLIRPAEGQEAQALIEILKRPARSKDPEIRALQYYALAATGGTEESQDRLLKCGTRTKEEKEARIAALIGLAYDPPGVESYRELERHLPKGRNDPVAAAMLFAMARTGEPGAVKDLIQIMKGGASRMRFYAAGTLLYLVTLGSVREKHPQEDEIFRALRGSRDESLKEIRAAAGALAYMSDREERRIKARAWFEDIADPYGLHLWDWTREDRAWALVNDRIPEILELDDIADKGNPFEKTKDEATQGQSPSGNPRAVTATPTEQDMWDFLSEEPYYGAEDRGAR